MILVLSSPGLVINLVLGSWDKTPLSHHLLVFLPHKPGHIFSLVDINAKLIKRSIDPITLFRSMELGFSAI